MTIKPPLLLLAAIAALPPLAVDMYLAAIPAIAADLNTPISTVQNSLSIFLVGFGLGMLLFGPLSDRFGRRPLALFGLAGFALSCLLISFSASALPFLLLRMLQGFIGSAATVTVPGMIRDCYGKNTAKGMSSVTMIMLLAPLVAPMLGSLLLTLGTWQLIFQALTAYSAVVLLLTFFILPETRPAPPPGADTRRGLRAFLGNYAIILAERRIHLDLTCFILAALAFFTYLTSVSFIYISWFGVSETLFGILFAVAASALIAANYINVRLVSTYGPRRMMYGGLVIGALFAALLVLVNLLQWNVYWTTACFAVIIGSMGVTWINADALVLIQFPNQASSAAAVTGTLRFGSGALAGPILALIHTGTPVPPALLIFGAIALAGALQALRHRQHGF